MLIEFESCCAQVPLEQEWLTVEIDSLIEVHVVSHILSGPLKSSTAAVKGAAEQVCVCFDPESQAFCAAFH